MDLYTVTAVFSNVPKSFQDILYHASRYLNAATISDSLYTGSLWAIKFAFLFFFRRLGNNVTHQKVIWWVVVIFNAACLGVWVGTIEWMCIAVPIETAIGECDLQT